MPRGFCALLCEAGPAGTAGGLVDRPIVPSNGSLRAVAPEMAGREMLAFLLRKSLLRGRTDVQAFRPQMFAEWLVHGINLSV